jgi:hypothetical protein
MGLNAASVHLRVGSGPEAHRIVAAAIRRALQAAGYREQRNSRTADRTLILHPGSSGAWLTIFDSHTEALDDIAAQLSRESEADALCTSIVLSDHMRLAWFRMGRLVDALTSQGRRDGGLPESWGPVLSETATTDDLREALQRPAIFAEDKLVALAGLLGLNRDLCLAHVDELLDAPGRPVGLRLYFRRNGLAKA